MVVCVCMCVCVVSAILHLAGSLFIVRIVTHSVPMVVRICPVHFQGRRRCDTNVIFHAFYVNISCSLLMRVTFC